MRYIPVIIGLIAFVACSKNSNIDEEAVTRQQHVDAAEALYAEAENALNEGDAERSLALLDSLFNAYQDDKYTTDVVSRSIALRKIAIVTKSENNIAELEGQLSGAKFRADSLSALLQTYNAGSAAEYRESPKSHNGNFLSVDGISGRIDLNDEFYIVSNVHTGAGHESITVLAGDIRANSDTVAASSPRNLRANGYETITFVPDESTSVGEFIAANRDKKITLQFNGAKGKSVALTPRQVEGIADAYAYAAAVKEMRQLVVELEHSKAQINQANQQ